MCAKWLSDGQDWHDQQSFVQTPQPKNPLWSQICTVFFPGSAISRLVCTELCEICWETCWKSKKHRNCKNQPTVQKLMENERFSYQSALFLFEWCEALSFNFLMPAISDFPDPTRLNVADVRKVTFRPSRLAWLAKLCLSPATQKSFIISIVRGLLPRLCNTSFTVYRTP